MKQFLRILSTFLVAFVLAAIATGCGEDYSPTAPRQFPLRHRVRPIHPLSRRATYLAW